MTVGRVLKEKGLAGALFDAVGEVLQRLFRMREADAAQLARLMFETDQAKVRATFQRLAAKYKSPAKIKNAMNFIQQRASLLAGITLEGGDAAAYRQEPDYPLMMP